MEQLSNLYIAIQLDSLEQLYQLTDKTTSTSPSELKTALGIEVSASISEKVSQLAVGRKNYETSAATKMGALLELLNLSTTAETKQQDYTQFFSNQSLPSFHQEFHQEAPDWSLTSFFKQSLDINDLWKTLCEKILCLSGQKGKILAHNLSFLLEKYTSFVPCGIKHLPDVSLYQHTASKAAFAISDEMYQQAASTEASPYLLIGGDVAGIQKFIYDIISKNAAKNLKGRSFYLQLIADSVLQLVLAELSLFKANIVYASGGGFYIIAPNTPAIKDKIRQLEKTLSNQLFASHGIGLFLALDFQEFGEAAIFGESDQSIAMVWQALSEKLNRKKRSRYADKIADYEQFFNPENKFLDVGGETLRDVITNEEIKLGEPKKPIGDAADGNFIKLSTFKQIELGKQLRAAEYLVSSVGKQLEGIEKKYEFNPCGFGVYYYLLPADKLNTNLTNVQILKINDTSFDKDYTEGDTNIRGYIYYGGNSFPAYEAGNEDEDGNVLSKDNILVGTPVSFGILAKSEGAFHRLGVLRMDVDNLGQSFISGFHPKQRTFSRFSTLSSQLDLFFMGYLNLLRQTYKDNTYIVYAGGDDLFIVGHWKATIQLADAIQTNFAIWTKQNPTLTLSGGLELVFPKFPIVKAADMAATAEKAAKNYSYTIGDKLLEKNAFNFLGKTLQWNNEFQIVKALKEQLLMHLREEKGSRNFLTKIVNLAHAQQAYELAISQGQQATPRWFWQCAYQFSQYAKDFKRRPEVKAKIEQLKVDVLANSHNAYKIDTPKENSTLQLLALAARWAEFIERSKINQDA